MHYLAKYIVICAKIGAIPAHAPVQITREIHGKKQKKKVGI